MTHSDLFVDFTSYYFVRRFSSYYFPPLFPSSEISLLFSLYIKPTIQLPTFDAKNRNFLLDFMNIRKKNILITNYYHEYVKGMCLLSFYIIEMYKRQLLKLPLKVEKDCGPLEDISVFLSNIIFCI